MRGQLTAGVVRWAAALLIGFATSTAIAQGAPWVVKRVHGHRFALAVDSVFDKAAPESDPRHARARDHRLRVTIRDERSGRATQMTRVTSDIAESGYAGTTIALEPVGSREPGRYEGRVRLRTDRPYRILIHATPADGGRTLEAQFEYRHHH